ncbi:MAG: hypothetical protein ABIM85_05160 [candidate division WOR-3 bacterium]
MNFILILFTSLNFWINFTPFYWPEQPINSPFFGIRIEKPLRQFIMGGSLLIRSGGVIEKISDKSPEFAFEFISSFELSKTFFNEKLKIGSGIGNFTYVGSYSPYPLNIPNLYTRFLFSFPLIQFRYKIPSKDFFIALSYQDYPVNIPLSERYRYFFLRDRFYIILIELGTFLLYF